LKKKRAFVFYITLLLAAALLLRLFDVITISASELLSYVFCIYGIALVYISFGKKKKLDLFVGTTTFLAGVLLFTTNKFDFFNTRYLIAPAVLFILGSGGLMVYIDDLSDKKIFFISLAFILFAFAFTFVLGSLKFSNFFYTIFYIAKKYWLAILILILVILFLKREDRK